jgi:hypothetical protein
VLNLPIFVLNLLLFLFFLIVIHNFLTLEYGSVRDMLMIRMASIILINHVVPLSHQLTLKLFFLYSVEFNNQIINFSFHLDNSLMRELIWIFDLICKLLYILAIAQSGGLKLLYSLVKPLYILATCNFNCTRKCTNRLQLMDCKYEVDPTGNCIFEEQFCF